ncbi:MAG: hypothetical protein KKF67_03690 [Nanoarchaeota archaeon]|nr:hypothetical protein [Nanoarchaeota archaeon]
MNTKNSLVFFLLTVSVLFSLAVVNAAEIANVDSVEVNGDSALSNDVSVVAGDTIAVKVYFTALKNASDVKIKVGIEGDKIDVEKRVGPLNLEDGYTYSRTLNLQIPYELEDQVSDDLTLIVTIWNSDHKTQEEMTLRVQRPSYNADIMSISTSQTVDAGENLQIDVVVKNIGYDKLNDLYVTAQITDLNLKRTSYFGDIVAYECYDEDGYCNEDDEDFTRGRFYLQIPYDVESGVYTLEVEAKNSDLTIVKSQEIVINNDFSAGNVIVSSTNQNAAVGQNAEYELLIVNPTNKLKVYRIVTESSSQVSSGTSQSVVAVPAGSSKAVTVTANANSQGSYNFDVNVFSGEKLVNTVTLGLNASGTSFAAPIVLLTVVLAIIFLVLLVVLIVLLGKKPEKKEEFGESYY